MKNKKLWYIIIGICIVIILFYIKFNEYRERDLVDLINYEPNDYSSMRFTTEPPEYEWWTKEKGPIDELMEFLGQYQVKKINEETYYTHLHSNSGESFYFTIVNTKGEPEIVYVTNNYVHVFEGNYYIVVNEPINMEWVKEYSYKHKNN